VTLWNFWIAPAKRSGDGAFEWTMNLETSSGFASVKSGVALRLPPQSMTRW